MSSKRAAIIIATGGLLWGLSEVFVGDVFYRFHVPFRGSSLTAIGLGILIIARLLCNRPGTSIAIALIAGGFRCLVPKLYVCHLLAIAIEGAAFDLTWSALRAGRKSTMFRAWLSGAIAAYTGFLAFGLISIHVFRFGKWVAAGVGGTLVWALRSGSFTAVLLAGLAPLAVVAARRLAEAKVYNLKHEDSR